MARVIHKEFVEIEGLNKLYERIVKFNTRSKFFEINYPTNVYADNLIKEDVVVAYTWEEAHKYWREKVNLFEAQGRSTEEVILYKYEATWCYKNGSGVGFLFQWGVFKKVIINSRDQYFYLRGGKNKSGKRLDDVWHGDEIKNVGKDWKELKNSPEREQFFETTTERIELLHSRLVEFFVSSDFEQMTKVLE